MKRKSGVLALITIFILVQFFAPLSVEAKKHKPGWFMSKKGYAYYYDENCQMVKNKVIKINDKCYYFDKKGRQHVGWVKYKKHYYYFKIAPMAKGYRVSKKTVNGIKTNERGRAINNRRKVRLLTEANKIVFSITNFKMSQKKKNRACFMYMRKIRWINLTGFKNVKDWDMLYAEYAIFQNKGDCYVGGCGFAYLAAAAGAKKVYAESSGGHGWAEINGRYYDPNWSMVIGVDKCYRVPSSLSGRDGRPGWARSKAFVKRID